MKLRSGRMTAYSEVTQNWVDEKSSKGRIADNTTKLGNFTGDQPPTTSGLSGNGAGNIPQNFNACHEDKKASQYHHEPEHPLLPSPFLFWGQNKGHGSDEEGACPFEIHVWEFSSELLGIRSIALLFGIKGYHNGVCLLRCSGRITAYSSVTISLLTSDRRTTRSP
jgi:hypothetical protein